MADIANSRLRKVGVQVGQGQGDLLVTSQLEQLGVALRGNSPRRHPLRDGRLADFQLSGEIGLPSEPLKQDFDGNGGHGPYVKSVSLILSIRENQWRAGIVPVLIAG